MEGMAVKFKPIFYSFSTLPTPRGIFLKARTSIKDVNCSLQRIYSIISLLNIFSFVKQRILLCSQNFSKLRSIETKQVHMAIDTSTVKPKVEHSKNTFYLRNSCYQINISLEEHMQVQGLHPPVGGKHLAALTLSICWYPPTYFTTATLLLKKIMQPRFPINRFFAIKQY